MRPSTVANELNASGVGNIGIIYIFRSATGAGLGDVKSLGQWWSPAGVTDADPFDAYAARLFAAQT